MQKCVDGTYDFSGGEKAIVGVDLNKVSLLQLQAVLRQGIQVTLYQTHPVHRCPFNATVLIVNQHFDQQNTMSGYALCC